MLLFAQLRFELLDVFRALVVHNLQLMQFLFRFVFLLHRLFDLLGQQINLACDQRFFFFEPFDILVDHAELRADLHLFGVRFVDRRSQILTQLVQMLFRLVTLCDPVLDGRDLVADVGDGLLELTQPALAGYQAGRSTERTELHRSIGAHKFALESYQLAAVCHVTAQLNRLVQRVNNKCLAQQPPGQRCILVVEFHKLNEPAPHT